MKPPWHPNRWLFIRPCSRMIEPRQPGSWPVIRLENCKDVLHSPNPDTSGDPTETVSHTCGILVRMDQIHTRERCFTESLSRIRYLLEMAFIERVATSRPPHDSSSSMLPLNVSCTERLHDDFVFHHILQSPSILLSR